MTSAACAFHSALQNESKTWLVTGVAGFIGSHLLENLLNLGQRVRGVDNFLTGKQANLDAVKERVGADRFAQFEMIHGDIVDPAVCEHCVQGVDYILHQAALGSVPRSINAPLFTHENNVTGTLNLLYAASQAQVTRFVYASSSSVYGDNPKLPKEEPHIGRPLSPYAASKASCEQYAHAFAASSGLTTVGLRYFNVFGPRQDPKGPYAAVIPKWIEALRGGEPIVINGDSDISRDFTYVDNVVSGNILAATAPIAPGSHVFNVACGGRITLHELFAGIAAAINTCSEDSLGTMKPEIGPPRPGDISHSHANIDLAGTTMGYEPLVDFNTGLHETVRSYLSP